RNGPDKTTRALVSAIRDTLGAAGVTGATVLDIGGGLGAIQLELLAMGAGSATSVDASPAYVAAATEEAAQRGYAERITHRAANFVEVAPEVAPADIVTLERVICCYRDMPGLVGASAARAQRMYGLVYPRDTWWLRGGRQVLNFTLWATRGAFRFYVHPTAAVEAVVLQHGLARAFARNVGIWQVVVFTRGAAVAS
ncbi:MAG TPA: methyltransferase domain-containing protein, partial [Ktedonobacterales bacterium]|nr:methyltransferase domain-containing protein [Ktedonobacterales bacterium]